LRSETGTLRARPAIRRKQLLLKKRWCERRSSRAGIARRGPYCLRHTFATEALAAGVSIFELARLMGTSVAMIDRTYGHLVQGSEDAIRARLDARAGRL
jgi:integrase